MSPLWRDHLRIGLAPDRLILAGYRRGLRPRLTRKEIIPVTGRDAAYWQAAVDALPAALARSVRRGTAVTVILSNHFVRYALLPWNATLKSEDEWLALARHRLGAVHGQAVGEWAVRICETAPRGARIVAAADSALLDALEEKLAGGGANFVSVQPYLMAAFNRIQPMIGNESMWLVIGEPGRLTLALIQDGVWRAIRSHRTDERTALSEILLRESAILALEEAPERVVFYAQDALDARAPGAFRLRDLTPGAGVALGDRQLAMALG